MIKFLRKRIKKENWRELSKDKIITKVLEYREEYEAVIVYKNDDYYGYIDLNQNPPIIMLPEYEPGFKPLELTFDDEIFEKAYDLFEQCTHLNMIPLNLELSADDIMIFACNICSVLNCKDLTSLAACVHNDRVKSFFAEKLQKNIKLVVLSELNEFTYKFYKVLKEIGVSTRTEGYLWTLIGINDNNTGVVSENKICYATPELVRHIGHFIYQKECVSEVEALRKKGINAYTLVIPYREDLNEFSLLEDIMFKPEGALSLIAKKKHKTKLDKYVLSKCLGDNVKNIIEAKEEYIYPDILGDEEATIYLVGPCIVSGEAGLESFSLARILKGLIEDKSLAYKIKRVGINRNNPAVVSIVEELDITDKDIVFLFREHWEAYLEKYDSCIDLAPVYHQRTTEQLFFTNIPIHTLRAGNEAIANYMLPYIIENASKSRTGQYLQLGVPFLTIREKKRLMNYIETVKIPCEINKHDTVGAIVMNGNPFTYGHMYLIEEAAKIVTYLYVMVVEEDLSEFKYVDRIRMIREGVRHIPNVSVVPSGSFVLSRHTFRAYFEKEEMQEEKIDVSKDIAIFGSYVAPALSINTRFIGKEPFDSVTRQYNAEMKKKLPLYGIEVSELSRKSIFISDTEECIISASLVRKLYQEENWDALRKLVPETTFQFLKTKPEMRDKKTIAELKGDACDVHEWTALFAKNEKVVLYATGDDGSKVYERLTDVQKKKVFFSDIKAIQKDYIFYGKNVLSPCMLIADLLEAPILITTKKYWADAWSYLIKLGIDSKRLHLNNALY